MHFALPLSQPIQAVKPAAAAAKPRLAYIDTIRVILVALVVMVHAAVTYGSIGSWFYVEPGSDGLTQGLLSIFVTLCQAFFMGTFFFISGYFIPGSIDRKGLAWFWKDRLLRLGLPFLLFSFVLAKYPLYVSATRGGRFAGSLWQFALQYPLALDAGPTWFLFALLVLGGVYSLYRALRGKAQPLWTGIALPGTAHLLGFALVMAAAMLLTSQLSPIGSFTPLFGFIYVQPAFFPQYLMLFAAGILAYRGDWLNRLSDRQMPFWRAVAAACALFLPVLFVGGGAAQGQFEAFISGFAWQALLLNLWVGLTSISFTLFLLLGLRAHAPRPSTVLRGVTGSAFAAYLIHPVILVAITTSLAPLALFPLLKWALAAALTIAASFALGSLLRQIPGVKAIL
jgi:glucans biosynthesis protein C